MITVPADVNFGSVNLKFTAGDIHLSGRIVETLNMDTVSGSLSLSGSQISDRAVLKTISGNIESTGTLFNSIQAKSVSGKINIETK